MDNDSEKAKPGVKKRKPVKFVLKLICVIVVIFIVWIAFSLIGRVEAASVIPGSADIRVSVANPVRLFDRIMSHESLDEISAAPALAQAAPFINMLKDNPLFKNRLVRLAARGNLELALLPAGEGAWTIVAALDLGFFSPLLRILPVVSGFVNIPNLYYVQAGSNSRFEYRAEGMTLFIGPYRNLLFVTGSSAVYEARSAQSSDDAFVIIKPSSYDAAFLLSGEFAGALLAGQDPGIAAVLNNIEFGSKVEAGFSVYPKKLEFRLAAPVSSRRSGLSLLLEQRSRAPGMAERIPADAQYATILSAGTLEELYQAALVFSPELDDTLRMAEISSRLIMGLTLNDLLFSWSGNEFAVFGMEGRPHPVYAIQIADERKRQEVFDRAFKSMTLNEDVRLNLDGMRIPKIEIPEFLQGLMRKWDLFLPSPYYIIHGDFLFASESAQTLLSALRAMQRNDVLPGTDIWRNISGGRTTGGSAASAFSLYYSLDLSVPFFLRKNTAVSGFLSLYRQGLARVGFDRGVVDITLSLVPGSGNGIALVSGYPLDTGGADRLSNRLYGAGSGENSRVFFTSGSSVISVNAADNSVRELSGQGSQWVIPAYGQAGRNANAWVVSDRGRVTLVDANLEPAQGFPALTGVRLSSPPAAYEGKLYLCGEDGRVHTVDENGGQGVWETSFAAAVRSPPSFLTVPVRNAGRGSGGRESGGVITYSAVYPKSFFGEIWLLDADGKALPNWPAPIAAGDDDDSVSSGIGFGSPLLFSHNDRVYAAFVNQVGQLLVYDENAAFVPPFPLSLNGIFYVQPVFDGEYLWLASSDGTFFRVSLDGEVLYQRIPGFSVMEEGYITVFDCNGDKVPEVFITGEGNALHAYTRGFRSLEGFPLPVWGRPLFVPAQGGRKAEIFGMGMDRRLYRWQFR